MDYATIFDETLAKIEEDLKTQLACVGGLSSRETTHTC